MIDSMSETKANLLWCDLEMTGLDPVKDRVLEIALIATDWDFNELATFESGFGYEQNEVNGLLDANPFYIKMKDNKRSLLELVATSEPKAVVEKRVVEFVKKHFDTVYPVVLAGNSIHMDRAFIREQLPFLNQLLHYRMLDVTAWKLVFEGKFEKKFEKQEKHRALDDIRESIAELKKYLESVKVK